MDVINYALSKKIAAHAVSGVQSMSVNGQTLTINTKDSGVLTMTFPTPKDGVSVTDIDVNANNQIVFTMSDGSEFISGKIPTVKGEPGFSPTITENADNTDKIYKLDITTADKTFTTPNLKGADGQGGGGDSSVTLTQEEYEALTEEQKLNGLYYIYDTKRIYKNGVQYGASEPIPLTMAEYEALKEAGAIDEQQEYLIEADDKGILINAKDIGYNNTKSGIQATTVQDAIDKIAENGGSGEKNVQSDWNETDDTADGFIKNKPTIPDITGLATETYVDNKVADYTKTADLADVAISGSYNDLADKPTIPSLDGYAKISDIPAKVSELENDSNYLSSIPEEYITETELNAKGYLTEHQDISNLVEKEDGKTLISTEDISQIAQNKADIETLNGTGEGSVEKKIADKLSEQTYLTKEIATADEVAAYIADPTTAKFNVIYLVKDESATGADKYFEYQRIGNEESSSFHMTGDTSTDLSDYAKTADIPTSLPANGGNADTVNNHTVKSDVPENAVFTDTVYDYSALLGYDIYNLVSLKDATYPANKAWLSIDFIAPFDGFVFFMVQTDATSGAFTQVLREDNVLVSDNQKNIADFNTWGEAYHHQIYKGKTYHFGSYTNTATAFNKVMLCIRKKLETPTEYVPYAPSNVALSEETTNLDNRISNNSYGEVAGGKNLLNPKEFLKWVNQYTTGSYSNDGITISPVNAYLYNNFFKFSDVDIDVTLSIKSLTFYDGSNPRVCLVNSSGTIIGTVTTDTPSISGLACGIKIDFTTLPTSITIKELMIEEGSIATSYEPYFPSNKKLAEEVNQQNESLRDLGKCKNLLKPTLQTTTQNGVTCTNNGDGTYTLNGTASGLTTFILRDMKLDSNLSYKLTGCPLGGNWDNGYSMYVEKQYWGIDVGKGYEITLTDASNICGVYIRIIEGTVCNNLIFKPMITTNLNAIYDDFVPYTGDGETLAADVAEIKNDLSNFTSGKYIDGSTDWNTIKTSGIYYYNGWSGSGGSNKPTETKTIGMAFVLNTGNVLLQFAVLSSGNSYFRNGTADEPGSWVAIS